MIGRSDLFNHMKRRPAQTRTIVKLGMSLFKLRMNLWVEPWSQRNIKIKGRSFQINMLNNIFG